MGFGRTLTRRLRLGASLSISVGNGHCTLFSRDKWIEGRSIWILRLALMLWSAHAFETLARSRRGSPIIDWSEAFPSPVHFLFEQFWIISVYIWDLVESPTLSDTQGDFL